MIEALFGINFPLVFNVFLAFLMSFSLYMIFGNRFIAMLHHMQANGQPIRNDGPKEHLKKKGTPTMGGLLLLFSAIVSILLFADLRNMFVWVCLFVIVVYGITGFVDDYEKVTKNTSKAMSAKMKLLLQFMAAFVSVMIITYLTVPAERYGLNFPFLFGISLDLGILYIPFAMVVIAGASNGVNLSDGLDGLAAGLLMLAFGAFMVVAFNADLPEIFCSSLPDFETKDIAVVCAGVVGACVGFLWFNAPKAQVFMGDTGSLALGALLGTIAVMMKKELLLAIIGGVFVMETISVFLQVFWYKKTGRRIFKMAPIHHHFEQCGWPEVTVTVRFWIVGLLCAVIGLSSLIFGIRF